MDIGLLRIPDSVCRMAKRKHSTHLDITPYHPSRIICCCQGDHSLSNGDLKIKVLRAKPPDELLTNVAKQMTSENLEKMKSSVKGKDY